MFSRIVHLAGLQIPFCRANPSLGAAVNVTGTINIFEAARAGGCFRAGLCQFAGRPWPCQRITTPGPWATMRCRTPRTLVRERTRWRTKALPAFMPPIGVVGSVGLRPGGGLRCGARPGGDGGFRQGGAGLGCGPSVSHSHRRDDPDAMGQRCGRDVHWLCRCRAAATARVCNIRNDVVIGVGRFRGRVERGGAGGRGDVLTRAISPSPPIWTMRGCARVLGTVPHTPLARCAGAGCRTCSPRYWKKVRSTLGSWRSDVLEALICLDDRAGNRCRFPYHRSSRTSSGRLAGPGG